VRTHLKSIKRKLPFFLLALLFILVFINLFGKNSNHSQDKQIFSGGKLEVEILQIGSEAKNASEEESVAGFVDSVILLNEEQIEIVGWLEFKPSSKLIVSTDAQVIDSRAIWYERDDLNGDKARKGFSLLLSMESPDPGSLFCLGAGSNASAQNLIAIEKVNGSNCFSSLDFK
jgi:hypothetical protein